MVMLVVVDRQVETRQQPTVERGADHNAQREGVRLFGPQPRGGRVVVADIHGVSNPGRVGEDRAGPLARLGIGGVVEAVGVRCSVRVGDRRVNTVVVARHQLQTDRLNIQRAGCVGGRVRREGIGVARRAAVADRIDRDTNLPLEQLFGDIGCTLGAVITTTETQPRGDLPIRQDLIRIAGSAGGVFRYAAADFEVQALHERQVGNDRDPAIRHKIPVR